MIGVAVLGSLGTARLSGADPWVVALGLITVAGFGCFRTAWDSRRDEDMVLEVLRAGFVTAPIALVLVKSLQAFAQRVTPQHGWSALIVLSCFAASVSWRLTRPARGAANAAPRPLPFGLGPDERPIRVRGRMRFGAGVGLTFIAALVWLWAHDAAHPERQAAGVLLRYLVPGGLGLLGMALLWSTLLVEDEGAGR
ncbi:MAG: hypothetical protein KF878_15555 [Planctomycetes bacterium]|nr:hypothetical protein [Planctomycetota bacterium]